MKRLKHVLAVILVAVLTLNLAACQNSPVVVPPTNSGDKTPDWVNMWGDNDFEEDGIDRDFDFSDYDYSPKEDFEPDTGELTDHIYEAETFLMEKSGWGDWHHVCAAKSFHFDPAFGGNICLKNISGASFKLTVQCDKDVKVPMEIRLSNQLEWQYVGADKTLADFMTVATKCGKVRRNVNLSEVKIPDGGTPIANNGFFNMVTVAFDINLGNGVNEIVFNTWGNVGTLNMDYVNIKTSAALSENMTVQNWFGEGKSDVDIFAPDETRTGSISFVCKSNNNNTGTGTVFDTLPSLNDGIANGTYRRGTGDDANTYYITLAGEEIAIKPYVAEDKPTGEKLGHITKGEYDFYNANNWQNDFGGSSIYGISYGNPSAEKNEDGTFENLTFDKASRFQLFWVKNEVDNSYYHICDNKDNWSTTYAPALFGQEFMYETEVDSDGAFMLELFGPNGANPELRDQNDINNVDNSSPKTGLTLLFNGSRVTTSRYQNPNAETYATITDAEGQEIDVCDGTTHTLSFCIVRTDLDRAEIRLFVDGVKVMFEATENYLNGEVVHGTMFLSDAYGYGQRFSVIPLNKDADLSKRDDYSTVKIYSLEIYKISDTPDRPVLSAVEIEYGDSITVPSGSTVDNNAIARIDGTTLTALAAGITRAVIGGEEKKIIVKPATVDVVLFVGQSNMVGRETTRYSVDIPSGKAYEYKQLSDSLVPLQNPVGENLGNGAVEASSGSSIVPQFCADYVETTGRKIVAVHVAKDGQKISAFAPGGSIYSVLTGKYGKCLTYLSGNKNFNIGKKFYVMFQGESDSLDTESNSATDKTAYKETYMQFHDGIMKQCGFEFGGLIQTGRNTNIDHGGIVTIAQAKNELAFEHDDIIMLGQKPVNYFVKNEAYMLSDNVHYNKDGLIRIAHDSCKALTDYLGYGAEERKDVDPVTYLEMPNDVQSFVLSPSEANINVRLSNTLKIDYTFTGTELFGSDITVQPMDGRIEWSSSDGQTATVVNGVVTALKTGTVTITAKPLAKPELAKTVTVTIAYKEDKPTGASLGHKTGKGADFYNADSWATYNNLGTYGNGTAKPTAMKKGGSNDLDYLSFAKAARFELFFVKGNNNKDYHLFDNTGAWGDGEAAGLFGQEFMYEMEFSADSPFMFELFGPGASVPEFATGGKYGITLKFDGSNVSMTSDEVSGVSASAEIRSSDAQPINVCDGTKHTISICVVRENLKEGAVRIFIDGQKVMFEQKEHYINGNVSFGTLNRTDAYGYGQRFGVVPMQGTDKMYGTVKIYSLEIYKISATSDVTEG